MYTQSAGELLDFDTDAAQLCPPKFRMVADRHEITVQSSAIDITGAGDAQQLGASVDAKQIAIY